MFVSVSGYAHNTGACGGQRYFSLGPEVTTACEHLVW